MAITGLEMADLVREACHDGGVGALVLGGAVPGYRGFGEAIGTGVAFPYAIIGVAHAAEWECGIGEIDDAGRLVRGPGASSAGGAAVDFTAGEKLVVLTPHAGWLAAVEAHGHDVDEIDGLVAALAGKQDASAVLDALAALTTTGFGRGILAQGDGAAMRAYIGAGTSSTDGTVTSVAGSGGATGLTLAGGPVTGAGTLTLGGTLAIDHGGTGATSAAGARTALGLGTAATYAVGTSGANIPTLNGSNLWSGPQTIGELRVGTAATPYQPAGFGASMISIASSDSHTSFASFNGGDPAFGPSINLMRSRGPAVGDYAAVTPGDWIGQINFCGTGNDQFRFGARIMAFCENTPGAASVPSLLQFLVGQDGAAAPVERFRISGINGIQAWAVLRPGTDNSYALGTGSDRWSVLYAATGTINTSDARAKCDVAAVDMALLDAWGDVQWVTYRWRDAVAAKGEAARVHVGLMAQGVRDAIDARLGEGAAVRLGLLCRDDLPDGEARWGLRYDQCLALEAAWQRRRLDRIDARIEAVLAGGGDVAG